MTYIEYPFIYGNYVVVLPVGRWQQPEEVEVATGILLLPTAAADAMFAT